MSADSAAIVVRPALPSDRDRWDRYVRSHAQGTFFHLSGWQEVLKRAFGHPTHYLLAERAGEIAGVLPLGEVRSRLFGHALVSTPFCVYGGVVSDGADVDDALTRAACGLAQELGVDHLEMRNRTRRHPDWPYRDQYVTFRKAIDPESEKNLLAIPRKQRAVVRKGIKEGLVAEVDPGVERHYDLYSESLRNLGTPTFSKRYLEVLREVFGEDCEVLTVTHQGSPVASCLSFYFRDEVLPYYGGGRLAARGLGGNDFMYWQIMERAREQGRRMFDFGRSKRGTGSHNFKRFWGFEPEPLYYEYFLVRRRAVPNLSPTNPKFSLAIAAWQRLPLAITRRLGPPIAKYLG
jgi:FemAB-related protein (PEP-CTERM system-associated)